MNSFEKFRSAGYLDIQDGKQSWLEKNIELNSHFIERRLSEARLNLHSIDDGAGAVVLMLSLKTGWYDYDLPMITSWNVMGFTIESVLDACRRHCEFWDDIYEGNEARVDEALREGLDLVGGFAF